MTTGIVMRRLLTGLEIFFRDEQNENPLPMIVTTTVVL
jgi:hypothetical protein